MNRKKKIYGVIGVAVLVLVTVAYMLNRAVNVETIPVERGTIQRSVIENGTVNAKAAHDLYTVTGGKVIYLPVEVGAILQQDEVIAILDNSEIELSISSAQTQLSQIKSALANQQAAIAGIRTELTAAEKQFVRIEGLYRAGGASQDDYANARLAVARLKKSLEEASNSLN